jgi:uncharacterized protein with beta-barrel porin domain
MVALDGTVNAAALLLSATAVALAAGILSDTVQVLDALLPRLDGAQDTDVSCAGAVAERVKDCAPPL